MNFKHGDSQTLFHKVWRQMHRRCRISPYYKDISVNPSWDNYLVFKKDMYSLYLKHKAKNTSTTLERKDNSQGYSKNNCRWATWEEQFRNQKNNRFIKYKGQIKTLSEWSRILGVHHTLLRYRIKMWGVKKAFTVPVLDNKTRHTLKHLYAK